MKKIIYPAFSTYLENSMNTRSIIEKSGNLKLFWDEYFENPEFKLTFSFSTFGEFKKTVSILSKSETENHIKILFLEPLAPDSDD